MIGIIFQSTLSRGERRGDAVYANKKRIDHWLKTLSLAGAPNGSLVVDSFNLSRIIPDETDLGKLFQSTLSRGERLRTLRILAKSYIFQSTLSRGERLRPSCSSGHCSKFQSTLSRGERPSARLMICVRLVYFNPRSHEESGAKDNPDLYEQINFNPRSHEESGTRHKQKSGYHCHFNPRSHEESGSPLWSWRV